MQPKNFRKRLLTGDCVLGTFLRINSPELVEIMGFAGFDFVVVDFEHGAMGIESLTHLVRAAETSGISPLVRVAQNRDIDIFKALDSGAEGIVVPRVSSLDEAQQAVAAAKFSPAGLRGACPRVRAAHYTAIPSGEYFSVSNEKTCVVLLIESPEGIDAIPDILQVKGVDAVMIGASDLSHAAGVPGQLDHPRVQTKIKAVIESAKNYKTAVGLVARDVEEARKVIGDGVRFIVYSGDETIFYEACRSVREFLKDDLKQPSK
jgi:4-hydroxy-2-oxoheptanedioate aldolase